MSTIKKTIEDARQFRSVARSADEIHTYIDVLRLKQYFKFYQESEDPEKTLWAWAVLDLAYAQGHEIPLWVQKHLASVASNLMALCSQQRKPKSAMKIKAIIKDGIKTPISKKIMHEAIIKAFRLKTDKGARSGIKQFSDRVRDFEIYLMIEEAKQKGESISVESVAIKSAAIEFNLSTDRTYKIYLTEKKRYSINT